MSLILKKVKNRIFNLRPLACMDASGRAVSGTSSREKPRMDLFRASLGLILKLDDDKKTKIKAYIMSQSNKEPAPK